MGLDLTLYRKYRSSYEDQKEIAELLKDNEKLLKTFRDMQQNDLSMSGELCEMRNPWDLIGLWKLNNCEYKVISKETVNESIKSLENDLKDILPIAENDPALDDYDTYKKYETLTKLQNILKTFAWDKEVLIACPWW